MIGVEMLFLPFDGLPSGLPLSLPAAFQRQTNQLRTLRPADHMQVLGSGGAATGFHAILTLGTKGCSPLEEEHFKAVRGDTDQLRRSLFIRGRRLDGCFGSALC